MTVSTISTGLVITASDVLTLGRSAVITASRVGTAASGDVAYTGVGFQPRTVIAFGRVVNTGFSTGFAAQGLAEYDIFNYRTVSAEVNFLWGEESYLISLYNSTATTYQKATLKTMDSDGFTLNWDKGGLGSDGQVDFLCLG